jgi:hypothetical protein
MQKSTHRSSIPLHVYECSGCICIHKYGCLSASKQVMDASWCIRMHNKYGCLRASKQVMDASWCIHMRNKYGCLSASKQVMDASWCIRMHNKYGCLSAASKIDWCTALCICIHTYGCLSASESGLMQAYVYACTRTAVWVLGRVVWCKPMYMHAHVRLFQR